MGRNWRPKYKAVCPKCGWTGMRVAVTDFCPKGCGVRCQKATTEPKDVRGGDEAKRSKPKASDPPPVREAVAWRVIDLKTGTHSLWFDLPDTMAGRHHIQPLYADPLPVSREAVARVIREQGRGRCECVAYHKVYAVTEGAALDIADAILALTGETSRE